jgi:hypothetical protein
VAQKSKNSYQKEKKLDLKTIKSFKNRQKIRQISDKKATSCRFLNFLLSLFVAHQKCDKKATKCDNLSLFHLSLPTPEQDCNTVLIVLTDGPVCVLSSPLFDPE